MCFGRRNQIFTSAIADVVRLDFCLDSQGRLYLSGWRPGYQHQFRRQNATLSVDSSPRRARHEPTCDTALELGPSYRFARPLEAHIRLSLRVLRAIRLVMVHLNLLHHERLASLLLVAKHHPQYPRAMDRYSCLGAIQTFRTSLTIHKFEIAHTCPPKFAFLAPQDASLAPYVHD